jgi:hypothetical protein
MGASLRPSEPGAETTAPSQPIQQMPSRRRRVARWLASVEETGDGGYRAGLTIAGAVGIAVAGIVASCAWLVLDRTACPGRLPKLADGGNICNQFTWQPEFYVWAMLIAAQVAFAAVVLVPLVRVNACEIRRLLEDGSGARDVGLVAVGAVALAGAAIVFAFAKNTLPEHLARYPETFPLSHYQSKIGVVVALVLAMGLAGVCGIWIAGLRADRLFRGDADVADELADFLHLRRTLTMLLGCVATGIGLATLATGALRQAVLAMNGLLAPGETAFAFDQQYVLLYGLVFTGLLAVAYAPSFLALKDAGNRLREATLPLLPPGDPAFGERVDARKRLDDFLEVSLSATASFRATVAILTPLASALVGLLLPKA